jgi:hypothetical protein
VYRAQNTNSMRNTPTQFSNRLKSGLYAVPGGVEFLDSRLPAYAERRQRKNSSGDAAVFKSGISVDFQED